MSRKISNLPFATPTVAMICYCVLAIVVTAYSAQQSLAQDEKSADADAKKVVATSQTSDSSKDASSSKDTKSSPDAHQIPNSLPVVSIKTNALDKADSLLNYSDGPFDVVVPDWYTKPTTIDDARNQVFFRAIGPDDETLQNEIGSILDEKVDQYVDQLLGTGANEYVVFTAAEKEQLVTQSATVTGIFFDGQDRVPWEFYFAQLEFDKSFEELARTKWIQTRQQSRLVQYGLIAGGCLLLVGFVFGGLRLNSATSGFYQGRLQFFVAIVILVVVAAGIYFGTQINWI